MKKSIIKSTILVFSISLLSKLIGFVKSIIQASYFGATFYTDAYNIAHGFVGNVLYMFTTAIAVAFVPLYIQNKVRHSEKKFATVTITILSLVSLAISVVLVIVAPLIVKIIAPSYAGHEADITTQYFRVLVLGFVFSLVANLYTNLLNAEKVFGFSSLGSVVNSVVLIAAILLFANSLGVWTLVISVPLSFLIQWLILYIKGKKYATISFKFGFRDESIKLLITQATPILISQATVEINQVIDRALLTSIGEGIVTAVSYSIVLYQFATTLIDAPISSVMFTELSEAGAESDKSRISDLLNSGYKAICIFCIPIVAVMFFGSMDIVNIVYGHGKFSQTAVENCAIGLQMYGLCLLPVCIKKIMSRAYYAVSDTKRPMIIGVLEVIMNITLSIILVRPFGIYGVVGATAAASLTFIIVMFYDFNKKHIKVLDLNRLKSYWKIAIAFLLLVALMIITPSSYSSSALLNFVIKTVISFGAFMLILLAIKESTVYTMFRRGSILVKRKLKRAN